MKALGLQNTNQLCNITEVLPLFSAFSRSVEVEGACLMACIYAKATCMCVEETGTGILLGKLRGSPRHEHQKCSHLFPCFSIFLYHRGEMQQCGDSHEPVMLPGGAKREWAAFEENADLLDNDVKRACTHWPNMLETESIPAMSISSWGPQGGFDGAMHQPEMASFAGGGIYQDFGSYGGYSTQTITGPLSLSSFLWPDSDTAPSVLEMGNRAGYPNYDTNTYSGNLAQLLFPSLTPAETSWTGLDIGVEMGEILPFQDLGNAAFESESSMYSDLEVKYHDRQYIRTALNQVASPLSQSVASQLVLPPALQHDDLASNLMSSCGRGALPGSSTIFEETGIRTSGGYAWMEPSSNSQKDPSQASAAQGSPATSTIDHSLSRDDLSDADTESDQMPLS